MKSLIKTVPLLVAIMGGTLTVKAQTATKPTAGPSGIIFSIGADGGVTTGSFRDSHKSMVGGSIEADIPVADKFYFTANTGYNQFFGVDNVFGTGIKAPDINIIPVKAGLKYFAVDKFYIQGEAGAAFALNKADVGFDKSAAFIYAPQIGYQFPLGGKSYLDAGVRYEASTKFVSNIDDSKVNFFGLRVAYGF